LIVPLAITGGYALDVAWKKIQEFEQPQVFFAVAALIVAICSYQMVRLNFIHYDDDAYAYVYAHTRRGLLSMLDEIDRIAKLNGSGYDTGITIASPDYWPLPWYFRDYRRVGYFGQITPSSEPVVIGSKAQEKELQETYGGRYELFRSTESEDGSFALRPGVDLLLYVERGKQR
jgi:predicted membrane-bound mannosyltransferase